ncbi:MAG: hypothetical protein Q7S80_01945 [bacterium]|nr:hypothetical protein [bacterium]
MATSHPNGQVRFVAASGAGAFTGRGWWWEHILHWLGLFDMGLFEAVVLKTLTFKPRKGNLSLWQPWRCIRLIWDGILNAVGLTNPGVVWFCREIVPRLDSIGVPLVVSLLGTPREIVQMIRMIDDLRCPRIVGYDINASCPNSGEDISANADEVIEACRQARRATRLTIWLKLSVVHRRNLERIIKSTEAWVECYTINSVPWAVYSNEKSPLAHLGGGGVSGRAAQPHTWPFAKEIIAITKREVVWSSACDYHDLERIVEQGGKVVAFGAAFIPFSWRPTVMIRRWKREHT